MMKFYIFSWITILIGLIFKLLHWPGADMLMIMGNGFVLFHSISFLIKNFKTDLPTSLLFLSISFWTIYLMFRVLYWEGADIVFLIAFIINFSCLLVYLTKNIQFKIPQILLAFYFIFALRVSFTPNYKIFYFMNFSSFMDDEIRESHYQTWDTYSWFLYIADKNEEALVANQKAQDVFEKHKKLYNNNLSENEEIHFIKLKEHQQKIKYKTWETYERLN